MTLSYFSIIKNRIKTSITSKDKYLFKDQLRKSSFRFIRFVLTSILCISLFGSALQLALPETAAAATGTYMLDKTIKWADGTSEHIQIGSDGFFRINGVKKLLVGMYISVHGKPSGELGEFWLPDNINFIDRELTYLEFIGVRVIHSSLQYCMWWKSTVSEADRYKAVMDLFYRHKMLVIPQIEGKGIPGFGNLDNFDFPIITSYGHKDTWGAYVSRWANVISEYQNVVSVIADNELNYPFDDQNYSAAKVAQYISWLAGKLKLKFNVPVITKSGIYLGEIPGYPAAFSSSVVAASLRTTDWPAFDVYANSRSELQERLTTATKFLSTNSYQSTGWWTMESGHETKGILDFSADWIDIIFRSGSSVVICFVDYIRTNVSTTSGTDINEFSYFDSSGNPKPILIAIAAKLPVLQSPIVSAPIPPSIATADPTKILAQAVTLNSKLTSLGTAPEVKVSFQWGTKAGEYPNETAAKSVATVGDVETYLSGLKPGTPYFYRAKAASDNTSYGAEKSFATSTEIAAPTLVSPANGATVAGSSVTFQWSASAGATTYLIDVSDSPSFPWPLFYRGSPGNVTTSTINGFPNNGTRYYWRVLAVNSTGASTWVDANANSKDFVNGGVVQAPSSPVLISPINGVTVSGSSVTFQWSASAGATTYLIDVSDSPSFPWPLFYRGSPGNVTTSTINGFPNNGTRYYWRVLAVNSTGASTWVDANANSKDFVNGGVVQAPSSPVLISPINGVTVSGSSVTFQWSASAGATTYLIDVSDSPSFPWPLFYRGSPGNVTTSTINGFPNNGTRYYWRVLAVNSTGASTWVDANANSKDFVNGGVVQAPSSPVLISPINGVTVSGSSVTFQWSASAGATTYLIDVSDSPSFPWPLFYRGSTGNVTTSTINGFPNNGTRYYWRVLAVNSTGASTWVGANANSKDFINGGVAQAPSSPVLNIAN